MIDLQDGDHLPFVGNRRGEIGQPLDEIAVDEDLLLPEHFLQIRIVVNAQRARHLTRPASEAHLLSQVVAALADDVDDDILDVEDVCRDRGRLREEVLRLDGIEARNDAVKAADAVVRVHDLAIEAIFHGEVFLEEVFQKGIAVLQTALDARVGELLIARAVGEVARQHRDEEVRNEVQELARIVEHRHEVAACPQKAVHEQRKREHRRDQRLLLAVEKSHAANVEEGEVERRHGVHRRAALQSAYARRQSRAREVLRVGDEALLEACETRAPRHRADVRDARIVHRAHRLPRLLEPLRERTHGTPAEFLFCDCALQDSASLRFARKCRLLRAREELAADRIKLLHRRCRRCADVQMCAIEVACRRLIDRIDCVTRIEKAAGGGGRLSVARQRTIHQSRAEEAPDEAVV